MELALPTDRRWFHSPMADRLRGIQQAAEPLAIPGYGVENSEGEDMLNQVGEGPMLRREQDN
jgi:hypothetical protein